MSIKLTKNKITEELPVLSEITLCKNSDDNTLTLTDDYYCKIFKKPSTILRQWMDAPKKIDLDDYKIDSLEVKGSVFTGVTITSMTYAKEFNSNIKIDLTFEYDYLNPAQKEPT